MRQASCVIYNPAAGRGRAERMLRELGSALGSDAEFRATTHPGHAIELARLAVKQGFARVVAAGGDGTVHEVANGILQTRNRDVIFSTIPLGSANDYAFTLGMTLWWRRHTERLPTDTLMADAGRVYSPHRVLYFVNALGIGFNGMVTLESRSIRWLRGMPLYALAFLRALIWDFETPWMQIRLDGEEYDSPTLALSVLLAQREGGFPLRPAASLTDGRFDIMHATRVTRGHLIRFLPGMMTGHLPTNHPLLRLRRSRQVDVRSEKGLCVHADGEFFSRPEDNVQELGIEILPAALRVEVFPPGLYGGLRGR